MKPRPGRQRGLSIVELMIGLLLGVLLLGGVLQIYLSSRQTYRNAEALARLQENGRFAIEFIAHDLRHAGYRGLCSRGAEVRNHLNPAGEGYRDDRYGLEEAVVGWDNDQGDNALADYRDGTDVVLVKHAAAVTGVTASGNTPKNANTINLTAASGIPAGQIVVVSDVAGCDIFQKRNNANANSLTRGSSHQNPGPGNRNPASSEFTHAYDAGMEIHLLRSALYYVGEGDSGLPALRRVRFDTDSAGVDEELVEGIVDLQMCYGMDADQDGNVDGFVDAAEVDGQWTDVAAVRVTVVALSPGPGTATDAASVEYAPCDESDDPVTLTAADHAEFLDGNGRPRLVQAMSTTIGLRNVLQ